MTHIFAKTGNYASREENGEDMCHILKRDRDRWRQYTIGVNSGRGELCCASVSPMLGVLFSYLMQPSVNSIAPWCSQEKHKYRNHKELGSSTPPSSLPLRWKGLER